MIRDTSTSLLPISRCWSWTGVKPVVMALFVPQISTKCTRAIRANNGITLHAMILSSRNSFSVRTYLPASLTDIIARANPVHHQDSNNVALFSDLVLAWGGVESMSRMMIMVSLRTLTSLRRGVSVEISPLRDLRLSHETMGRQRRTKWQFRCGDLGKTLGPFLHSRLSRD